jgi:hypothetical protein
MTITISHNDILKAAGTDPETIPGFKEDIEIALAYDVDVFPSLPASPATNTEVVTIDDDVYLKVGHSQYTIEAELLDTEIKGTLVGGKGSRVYKYELKIRLTGTSVDIEAFSRMVKNATYYVAVTGLDGVKRLLGLPDFPCTIELSDNSMGKGPEDEGGVFDEYTIVGYGLISKPPRWTGDWTEGSGS